MTRASTGKLVQILVPRAGAPSEVRRAVPPLADLRGRRVGFRIDWSSFVIFSARIEELLRERFSPAGVHRWNLLDDGLGASGAVRARGESLPLRLKRIDELARNADWAIVGLAA